MKKLIIIQSKLCKDML